MSHTYIYGFVLLLLSSAAFGASSIMIKLGYSKGLSPAELLTLQNLLSLVCLWPWMIIRHGLPRLGRRQWAAVLRQGLLGNLAISICYYWGADRLDISLVTIIMFSYPALVVLYTKLFENRFISSGEKLALFLCLIGALLAVHPVNVASRGVDGVGLAFTIGAAVSYAFLNIHGEKLSTQLPTAVITALTTTVSTIGMIILYPPTYLFTNVPTLEQWTIITGSALLSTVIPMNLFFAGIRRVGAFYGSIISVTELPFTLWLAYLVIGERLFPSQIFGAALILASVFLLQRNATGAARG